MELEHTIVGYEGELMVVDACEVDHFTHHLRWVVLATYEVDVPSWDYQMTRHGEKIHGAPKRVIEGRAPHTGYSRHDDKVKDDESPHFSLRRRYFVLGRSKDKVMERMRERMSDLEDKAIEAGANARGQVADAKISFDRAEKYKKELGEERRAHGEKQRVLESLQETAHKMEGDLAKVREALGSKQWTEIMG